MKKVGKKLIALLLSVTILTILASCGGTAADEEPAGDVPLAGPASEVEQEEAEPVEEEPEGDSDLDLLALNWVPETHAALNKMLREHGIRSESYDENDRPYVVFDFDNTTSFFDVQEALLIYQLENLRFMVQPGEMYDVLTTAVDAFTPFEEDYVNAEGETLNVDIVARDCDAAYTWLYENYEGFGADGEMSLDAVRETPQYQDFTTKVRFLYEAIGDTFDASVSYPWVTYLFAGMTSDEVRVLATDSHDYWFAIDEWEKVTWTSPLNYDSEAGVVTVSYKTSITLPGESVDLYQKLAANGFDIYICSASFIDVIEALAYNPKYGLNVEEGRVYAMMLKTDEEGRYINEYNDDYYQTQGMGKKHTIDTFIVPEYNGRGPTFVAGDSQGDYEMITLYDDMVLGLCVNRVRSDDFGAVCKMAVDSFGQEDARYVIQGRNENTGEYIPTPESIMLGKDEPQLLNEKYED